MQAGAAGERDDDEQQWQAIVAGSWPFQRLCGQCCVDVLDPAWEVRHGAAVALREVLRSHAPSAGVHAPVAATPSGIRPCDPRVRLSAQEVDKICMKQPPYHPKEFCIGQAHIGSKSAPDLKQPLKFIWQQLHSWHLPQESVT